jgi:transcriptional regulator with XRE-family HTH domain
VSIGERIIQLRTQCGINQSQLAAAIDVSRQAVSKWENGQSVPCAAMMIKLADVLNTDIEYLSTGRSVVPTRPPVVLETVRTVEKIVEKPVVVEKIVERRVEVPVVEYIDRPVVKRQIRTRYIRNPLEFAALGFAAFLLGLLIGFLL